MRILLSLLLLLLSFTQAEAESFHAKIVGVTDGDSITALKDDTQLKLRLWGINCPERNQPFYQRAKQAVADLTFGKVVTVTPKGTDMFGRTLAVVSVEHNERPVNHILIEEGLCWWFQEYVPEEPQLEALERKARDERRGVWSSAVESGGLQDGSGPIIGNKRRRVYHRPDCSSYGSVGVKNRVVFADEQTAKLKGYRLAGNCKAASVVKVRAVENVSESPVRGNRRSRIFHLPNCPSYNKVAEQNRVTFSSIKEAEAGGYRLAKNCRP